MPNVYADYIPLIEMVIKDDSGPDSRFLSLWYDLILASKDRNSFKENIVNKMADKVKSLHHKTMEQE
jgi:hypothetical protein